MGFSNCSDLDTYRQREISVSAYVRITDKNEMHP